MKDIEFFDPHLIQYVKGKDEQVVSERMKHTGLEFLFPDAKFSIAILDERTTAKELHENHPDGDQMLLASGKRFVFTDGNTIEGLKDTLPGKVNPIAYGSLLLKECSAKNEQLRVRVVSANSDPYEVELAAQTWKNFQETGELMVDVDPTNYLSLGYERDAIPQLLLPKSAMPDLDSKVLHVLTPSDIAEKLDINVGKIELAPHNFVRSMRILVVDSKTGASSSTLNPETGAMELGFENIDPKLALSLIGDGHCAISNRVAKSKFGVDGRTMIQMRMIGKNQDPNEVSKFSNFIVGKGTVLANDNVGNLGYDMILDNKNMFKGSGKLEPGIHNVDMWMGEIDRSKEGGKQSIAALVPLYHELLDDIIPIIEPAVANLSAIQNDPIAVAKSFCDDFEKRQDRLIKGQMDIDDDDNPVHLLPTEKYDVIKQSLETGNTALLQSALCAPTLIDHLRTSYLSLALGSHEDLKFNRSMIAPSKELTDDEICIPGLDEGTVVIVGRAPVIGKNGIHLKTVKHTEQVKVALANGDPLPNFVSTNDSAMSLTPGQQSAVVDMGADWDGDHIFWKEADLMPNLARGVAKHQADRDMDNIKLSKSEFGPEVSIEEAALQAETAPVGVIANTLIKTHSQISAIEMLRDADGVATDTDRSQFAQKIRDELYKFNQRAEKNEESLLLRPENLEGDAQVWFDRLEKCTNARVSAIIDAPRFDLITVMPKSDEDRHVIAKAIKSSLYGFSKNHEDVWFSPPAAETLEANQQKSFKDLTEKSSAISKQIRGINKTWLEEPSNGVYDTAGANQVLESYQELQRKGAELILVAERDLLRDMVGVISHQSQIAVSMKKSADIAEAPLVQRINHFLPSKTPMLKEKKNGIAYTDAKLTIDGITPEEAIADRVNHYFEKSQIKVSPAVCFNTLFDKTYTPEILARVSDRELAFDSNWNHAVRLSAKAKSEEGCVLKVSDSLGREIEITNLCKFSNDLAYSPEKLAGLKWKIEANREATEHGIKSYLPTEHKYVVRAQTSIVAEPPGLWDGVEIVDAAYDESPPRLTSVIGTVCEFSRRDLDISDDEIDVVRSFVTAELSSAQPDISAQYFEKARDIAIKFRTTLVEEGADLSVHAAALWHKSTNRKGGISVDDPNYSAAKNAMSGSICYFFPDELKAQIELQPLNLHRISLIEGVNDLAVGDSLHFKGTRDKTSGSTQRSISLSSDGGENFTPIATPWVNSIPMDMSGRSLSGHIVVAGNAQMLLQVPGIDEPIVFGAVDKNFLKDRAWLDGAANVSFEPIVKTEYSLHLDGKSLGKVDTEGTALIQKYNLDSGNISATITQKTEGKQSGVSISIPGSDKHPAISFDLQSKGLINLDGRGNNIDRQVKAISKSTHGLGVFMTGEDGIKHQIGEFTTSNTATPAMAARTTHSTSAKSIKALVKAGYIEWQDLKLVQHDGSEFLQGEKPNRSFAPVVLKVPGEVQLLNSNQNFAIELDRDILPERLPVIQQEFGENFIGRVYGNIAPIIESGATTLGVMPKYERLKIDDRSEVVEKIDRVLSSDLGDRLNDYLAPESSNADLASRIDRANNEWAEASPIEIPVKSSTADLLARMKARAEAEVNIPAPQELDSNTSTMKVSAESEVITSATQEPDDEYDKIDDEEWASVFAAIGRDESKTSALSARVLSIEERIATDPEFAKAQEDMMKREFDRSAPGLRVGSAPMKVVISGSRSIEILPKEAFERIDTVIGLGAQILVGDAPGVDVEVQKYLKSKDYDRVTVYHAYNAPRNNEGFPSQGGYGSYIDRDKAMCDLADRGLAVWDGKSKGTKDNIDRVPTRVVRTDLISKDIDPKVNHSFIPDDIFRSKAEALVDAVNCRGVKGAGLALQFKEKFPDSFAEYRDYCQDGKMKPGAVLISQEKDKLIVHFPTKDDWKDASQLEWIKSGLVDLTMQVNTRGISSIAIPKLGCGLGGLDWADVRPMIVAAAKEMPNCKVEIYGEEQALVSAKSTPRIANPVKKVDRGGK